MKSSSTPASIAREPGMNPGPPLADTCRQLLREGIPNFFRLYLNPFVVQTCLCLDAHVRSAWPGRASDGDGSQSFLANSFDEALSGAIKLARYCLNVEGGARAGLVLDPAGRLGPFASVSLEDGRRIDFIPDLLVAETDDVPLQGGEDFGFVVVIPTPDGDVLPGGDALGSFLQRHTPLIIWCVDRATLNAHRKEWATLPPEWTPDIVVFDESFVDYEVPFGAFTARRSLYAHWNKRGKSAFHSTTFQPNAIAALHFLKCLEQADPAFHSALASRLERMRKDPAFCLSLLGKLYSPFLASAIRSLGMDTPHVHAAGHHVSADDRHIFDCVAGVACSVRGHNPPSYVDEVMALDVEDCPAALTARLRELTGLGHVLPAVSGSSAVENALRLALTAGSPRRHVLAFQGGFGGKTLFALTGTARGSYKEHLDPLYGNVLYVDPFRPDVLEELDAVLDAHPVAVVQLELIQAVGGVRSIPGHVVEYLKRHKERRGYLLFVDEVQTGMYRTGPFTLSHQLGIRPDLLTLGKGTSDMMFPFALTLYSDKVHSKLAEAAPSLAEALRTRHAYEWGYRTVLNVLRQAEVTDLGGRVEDRGALFAKLLSEELAECKAVRDVRVHGLLIAIELDARSGPRRWLKKYLSALYLLRLLRAPSFPLFVGFCQYEPNVLKLTPPLTITPDEVRRVCATLASVLRLPLYKLLAPAAVALASGFFKRRPASGPGRTT
jgi:acetylornithine/succinyldiaminopimelate/putrescine aminotransferase